MVQRAKEEDKPSDSDSLLGLGYSLGPSFSGKLSPPPPTLQPESPVTEGPSPTLSQRQS